MELNEFEIERPRLSAIATRILGGSADVDDIVQEAHLKLSDADGVDDVPAWLTTVVTRLCLDRLRRRRSRLAAETAGVSPPERDDAQADVLLAEQVGDALQLVLDALAPAERATLVLHDVFGYPFDEVAQILGRSATAVRQLASRARRTVRGEPEPRARAENRAVVEAFLDAARGGDVATLLTLLAPDAVMRADLIGQQMGTEPVYDGATAVAERFNGARGAVPVTIDGDLAAAWIAAGEVKVAFVFHVDAGTVREVELIADPEVLVTLDVVRVRHGAGNGA